jgi:hypothetical protein
MTIHVRLSWRTGFVALAFVLLGACTSTSSGDTSADSGGDSKPSIEPSSAVVPTRFDPASTRMCAILTNAEVAEAVGEMVTTDDTDKDRCRWENANTLKAVVLRKSFAPSTPEDIASRRAGYSGGSWVKSDLGEDGFEGLAFPSIDWIVGEYNFELNVAWSTKGKPIPIAKRLAEMADERIARP